MQNTEALAKNALVFLARTDMKGSEAGPFQEVVTWLNSFLVEVDPISQEKKPEETED